MKVFKFNIQRFSAVYEFDSGKKRLKIRRMQNTSLPIIVKIDLFSTSVTLFTTILKADVVLEIG